MSVTYEQWHEFIFDHIFCAYHLLHLCDTLSVDDLTLCGFAGQCRRSPVCKMPGFVQSNLFVLSVALKQSPFHFACRSATDFFYVYNIYIYISTIYLYRELALETSFWDVRRTSARLYIKWYFLCQITFIVYLDYLYDFSMLYSLTDCPMHPSGTLHTAMWDCLWTVFYRACSFPYQRHAPVVLFFSGKRKLLTVILSVHAFGCYKKGITTLFRHRQSFVRLVLVCAESWSFWIGSGFLHYLVFLFVYVP